MPQWRPERGGYTATTPPGRARGETRTCGGGSSERGLVSRCVRRPDRGLIGVAGARSGRKSCVPLRHGTAATLLLSLSHDGPSAALKSTRPGTHGQLPSLLAHEAVGLGRVRSYIWICMHQISATVPLLHRFAPRSLDVDEMVFHSD